MLVDYATSRRAGELAECRPGAGAERKTFWCLDAAAIATRETALMGEIAGTPGDCRSLPATIRAAKSRGDHQRHRKGIRRVPEAKYRRMSDRREAFITPFRWPEMIRWW